MKKLLKGLEINENDTIAKAATKGLARGWGQGTLFIGAMIGTILIVDKLTDKNDKEDGAE